MKSERNESLLKSYVFHGDKCFFVSTIDRQSSSMMGGRYAETMAWDFDWASNERGSIIGQDEAPEGSINGHIRVCRRLFETGRLDADD